MIFRQLGERHRAGRALVKHVHRLPHGRRAREGDPLLYQALELIDPAREPRLLLVAWHNLIDDLAETGQFMEAQKLLVKARPLYHQFPQPWSQNPRQVGGGTIARGSARIEKPRRSSSRPATASSPRAQPTTSPSVSLDLASLYAEQGRTAELKRLGEEMVPIFSSRQIHREALAALAFWKQAVEAERAGAELVTGVASFLKRARHDPESAVRQAPGSTVLRLLGS